MAKRKDAFGLEFPEITKKVQEMLSPNERTKCRSCGKELLGEPIFGFPHDEGWVTAEGKFWLYITCTCGYQLSIWKMGISRSQDFSE